MCSLTDDAADTAAEGVPGAPPCRGWTPHGAACAACRPTLASLPARRAATPLSSQPNDNNNNIININNNSSCRGAPSDEAGRVPSASPPASSGLAPRRGGRDACPMHGREGLQLTLFCMRCRERLCYRCAYEGHREHTALPLSAAQDKAKKRHAEAMARLSAELGRLRDLVARRGEAAAAELVRVRLGRLASLQLRQGGLEEEWGHLDSIAKTREQRAFLQAFSTLSEPVFEEENDKWDDEDGDDGGLRSLEPLRAWLTGQKTPRRHRDPRRVGPLCSPPAPGLPPRNQPIMDGTRIRQSRAHAPCVAPPDPHRHRHHHHDHDNHRHYNERRQVVHRFPTITATSSDGGVFDFCLDPGSASPGLRLSADRRAVECCAEGPRPVARHIIGSAIGVVVAGGGGVGGGGLTAHGRWHQATARQSRGGNVARRGAAPPVRSRDFLTVLGDRAIPAGQRCYWEVSVNRAGDFRVGVSLAGPRPGGRRAPPPPPALPASLRRRKRAPQRGGFDEEEDDDDNDGGSEDDHDDDDGGGDLDDVDEEGLQWTLVLLGAERLFAVHGATRERVFLPALAAGTRRLGRVGVMSDGGRGVLAFYDASAGGDKRHLHTFRPGRGLLARPLYPLLALRAGRLAVVSGLEVPPRLVWRAAQRQRCA
ncbi:unnamed protein product [Lampetra fluviatilis]